MSVKPKKIESERDVQGPISEQSNSPKSEQQVQQAFQQGSSYDPNSPEESPRPTKHPIRRKLRKQVIRDDCLEDSVTIEPSDTGQPFFHSLASPKLPKGAFSLQPSARAPSITPEPIDLRSLSTRPMTSRSRHQDDSVLTGQNCAKKKLDRAKSQDSTTPIKSPRRSISHSSSLLHQIFSNTSEKSPSVLSGTPSPGRRNWSWWKLLLADTQSDATEVFDKGSNRSISDKIKADDSWPLPKGSHVEYFQTRPPQEAEKTPAISELKHDESHETKLGDSTAKANKSRAPQRIQRPPEPRTLSSSAFDEPNPASPREPKPRHPQHHLSVWVANLPSESLLQGSSGAASPVRSQATSSNGFSKRGNRGQQIKRVQVIVTMDGSSDVMIEASMKMMRMS